MDLRKRKKMVKVSAVVGICIILVTSGILFMLLYPDTQERKTKEEPTPSPPLTQLLTKTYEELQEEGLLDQIEIVDNRIAPYENQALVLEVLRIRHRRLLDLLLKPGLSWKQTPEFYYISTMDGMEYVSKDIGQHNKMSEVLFATWDTIFQENKVMRTAEQEQETSQVTLTIIEREKTGLFGLRTRDVEKDSFTVTYCYRTGRWSGDDSFLDADGYGYYLGDTFEIWFNLYQTDYDNDHVPYWMETNILKTDGTVDDVSIDPDNDGAPLFWEWKWGYHPYIWDDHMNLDPDMDSITNYHECQFVKYYADPYIENIYVEVDHMEATGINDPEHVFYEESKQGLIERYAQHNIKAFFDDGWPNSPSNGGGQSLKHYEQLSQDSGMILQYYNNDFPDERKGTFIYCLLGHKGGYQHPAQGNVYDAISVWTTPFTIFSAKNLLYRYLGYGQLPTPRGIRVAVAGSLLHELGHFGGLVSDYFGGVDTTEYNIGGNAFDILQGKEFRETWGKYHSVMNYAYIYRNDVLDYSNGSNGPPYDQNDWENLHFGGWGRTALEVEEAYYLNYGDQWDQIRAKLIEKNISLIDTPPITGYVYDQNLTDEFTQLMGDWSPNTRWDVEWEVHRLVEKEHYPYFHDIKIFVSPKDIASKYHMFWSLYKEGDLDPDGTMIL